MNNLKTILAVTIIFALGTVFGLLISHRIPPGPPPPRGPVQVMPLPQLNRLLEQDLSNEQKEEISRILEEVRVDLDRIRERARPEIHRRLLEAQRRIREILTPEQQRHFDRIIRDQDLLLDRPFRP